MGSNPINLIVRFILEMAGLLALGRWGWLQAEGVLRYGLAVAVPLLAAVLWGTFAVPGDPSRSGKAPVPVAGVVRLILELVYFGAATWALFAAGVASLGWIFGVTAFLHYLASYDRVAWLLRQKPV